MSAAIRRPPGGPDDPRDDIPDTHDTGGHCAAGDCYNERWVQPIDRIINGEHVTEVYRRYCRRCSMWLDAAIMASGGGAVIQGPWQK